MGQNQDKLDGGEQVNNDGQEEPRTNSNSGSTGDFMEGGSACEAEAGNIRENTVQPDIQELEGSPSLENINSWVRPFAARDVRQGGVAGRDGGEGGEGGRATLLDSGETEVNQMSSARVEERAKAYKLYNQIKREEKSKKDKLHGPPKTEMESSQGHSPHRGIQDEHISEGLSYGACGHAFTLEDANMEEDHAMLKMSRCGAQRGRELLSSIQHDQNDTVVADITDGDIKLCAGTEDRLRGKKGPPTAQSLHPLKNTQKKESLSDMSDTIQHRPEKKAAENNTKEETLVCEVKPVLNDCSPTRPKTLDTDHQKESVRPYLKMGTVEVTTSQKTDSNPESPAEPSSILKKLLMRNKNQTSEGLSEIREVDINEEDIANDTAQRIVDSADTELSPDKIDQAVNTPLSACTVKGLNKKSVKGNAEDHHLKSQVDNIHAAVLHERVLCEASDVIIEKSSSSTVSDPQLPAKSDGQLVDSCNLLNTEKTDTTPHLQTSKSNTNQNIFDSICSDNQSLRNMKVKNFPEDTAVPTVDAGSLSVPDDTGISMESHQVTANVKQGLYMTPHRENVMPDETSKNLDKESDDSVSQRDKSQDIPKSRPVSELIKETIQLHKKLQHQEWAKPAEVRPEEQGQSVKVAQMKAAFDSVQKSPDNLTKRKPSVRKGKVNIQV